MSEAILQKLAAIVEHQANEMVLLRQLVAESTSSKKSDSKGMPGTADALSNVTSTPEFVFDPENDLTFESWYARHQGAFTAATSVEAEHTRLVLTKLDDAKYKRYADYILPKLPNQKTLNETISTLKDLFGKTESLFAKRFNCLQLVKDPSEDYASHAARVNRMCELAQLKTLSEDQFKCLIYILSLKDPASSDVRLRLHTFVESKPSEALLSNLVAEARKIANIKTDNTLGTANGSLPQPVVAALKKNAPGKKPLGKPQQQRKEKATPGPSSSPPKAKYPCRRCGQMHFTRDCDFLSHTCTACRVIGHKEGYCASAAGIGQDSGRKREFGKSKQTPKLNSVTLSMRTVTLPNNAPLPPAHTHPAQACPDTSITPMFVNKANVAMKSIESRRKYVACRINDVRIVLQLDTGADVTALTPKDWNSLGNPPMCVSSDRPLDVNQNPIPILGQVTARVQVGDMLRDATFYVADIEQSLFGNDWMDLFELWPKSPLEYCMKISLPPDFNPSTFINQLRHDFQDVFSPTLGCCRMPDAKLTLRDPSTRIFRRKRDVPFCSRTKVEEELNRLQEAGIISPVTFSEFAAPIVCVQKPNGKIRICADYSTGLNDALRPHEYPIPTPEQIFASLSSNCYIFSQIDRSIWRDLSDAYLQIPVDDEAKKMLSITTHRGIFSFNRLCPGVKPAAGIFQQTMDMMLQGLDGVVAYFDDILVASNDLETHKATLKAVFERLRQFNFRARAEKCNFFKSQLRFLGLLVDKDGLRPDPQKTAVIRDMPPPTSASEVRSFL